jgi:hypothetical protein
MEGTMQEVRGGLGRLALVLMALSACGKDDDTTDTDTDTDADTDTDTDGVSPTLASGEFTCGTLQSGVTTFFFRGVASDPQGADTVKPIGSLINGYTVEGEQEIFSEPVLVCAEDGNCSGSFIEGTYGNIPCSQTPEDFMFRAILMDDDDNASAPFDMAWVSYGDWD